MGRFDGDRGVPHCLACPGRQTGVGEWLVGGLKQGHPNETRASHSGSRRLKGREKSD